MSEQTKAALDAAIAAHIADECEGDHATAWVVVADTTSLDDIETGRTTLYICRPEMQSRYTSDGLLYNALNINGD